MEPKTLLVLWQWSISTQRYRTIGDCLNNPFPFDYSNLRFKKYCQWIAISTEAIPSIFLPYGINPNYLTPEQLKENIVSVDPGYLDKIRAEKIIEASAVKQEPLKQSLKEVIQHLVPGEWREAFITPAQFKIYKVLNKTLEMKTEEGKTYIRKSN